MIKWKLVTINSNETVNVTHAENKEEANITKVRVLKSRYTGDTGLACSLTYDTETGRLHELSEEETLSNEDDF